MCDQIIYSLKTSESKLLSQESYGFFLAIFFYCRQETVIQFGNA
ncbi:hypothetical protein Cal7507_3131 [Calothrix sp. PCC 7507]|nr:hypothetical protein Cal7507_3131 [Calothrix sp. PCC 7507]